MTIQEILNSNNTKTRKIELLLQAGMSRTEIANLGVLGKYGAIQNVYAKMQKGGLPNRRRAIDFFSFDRRFGVEIEAYNIPQQRLFDALIAEGIQVAVLGRDTRANSWKITTDGSISGNGVTNAFELVSPILIGEAGLADLEKVCRVLGRLNAKINKSCGLHIHFEAISFNLATWKNLMLNYAKLPNIATLHQDRACAVKFGIYGILLIFLVALQVANARHVKLLLKAVKAEVCKIKLCFYF